MKKKYQIFISSTYKDMIPERQAAVEAILEAGHIPAGMELFVADDKKQFEVIKKWINSCDMFLLILGGRAGSIEKGQVKSYIQREYEYAKKRGKRPRVLIMKEEGILKKLADGLIHQDDLDNPPPEYAKFKDELSANKMASFFSDTKDLKNNIANILQVYCEEDILQKKGWISVSDLGDQLRNNTQVDHRINIEQECELETRWMNATEIFLVNYTSTSFHNGSAIASTHFYDSKLETLFKKKVQEGVHFKFILTQPYSYADYDAAVNNKMNVALSTSLDPSKAISLAAKSIKKIAKQNSNVEVAFCDIAFPYAVMLVTHTKEYQHLDSAKVDLYSPYIRQDSERCSFIVNQGHPIYEFFESNVMMLWKKASEQALVTEKHLTVIPEITDFKQARKIEYKHIMFPEERTFANQQLIYTSGVIIVKTGKMIYKKPKGTKETILIDGDSCVLPLGEKFNLFFEENTEIYAILFKYSDKQKLINTEEFLEWYK